MVERSQNLNHNPENDSHHLQDKVQISKSSIILLQPFCLVLFLSPCLFLILGSNKYASFMLLYL